MFTVTYDSKADALYIHIRDGQRSHTTQLDDRHSIDLDADGNALGIEVLYPDKGVHVLDLAYTYQLPGDELAKTITDGLGRSVPMTATATTETIWIHQTDEQG